MTLLQVTRYVIEKNAIFFVNINKIKKIKKAQIRPFKIISIVIPKIIR